VRLLQQANRALSPSDPEVVKAFRPFLRQAFAGRN
jgi:hypothetical protein